MKRVLILMACLILAPITCADQPASPPVPVPGGDNSSTLPPPLDINQTTPVEIPSLPDITNQTAPPEKKQAAPTATPIPAPPPAHAPTNTPVPPTPQTPPTPP